MLASISLSNVKAGHPWLYHLHALAVLWVVFVVRLMVFEAQDRFLAKRKAWLRALPYPQANTILVEGIPEDYRVEHRVTEFFAQNVGAVSHVTVVKDTAMLEAAIVARDSARKKLQEAESGTDLMSYYGEELRKCEAFVKEERARVKKESAIPGGVNAPSAFVTFTSRKDAELAKAVKLSSTASLWVVHDAPDIAGVRWQDLYRPNGREYFGYFLILLLFANFSPICLAISSVASEIHVGRFQSMWAALAPTLGLTVFLSMLPTATWHMHVTYYVGVGRCFRSQALLMIFGAFFNLRAEPLAQHELQVYYFLFQGFFILFLPVIGADFRSFFNEVVRDGSFSSLLEHLADRCLGRMSKSHRSMP